MAKSKKSEETPIVFDVSNSLRYEGNVKVKVLDGSRLLRTIDQHNTGTLNLCKYIRDVLIGLGASVDQPSVIKPCYLNGSKELVPISNLGVPFISRWRGKDSAELKDSIAVIKFLIPWTKLSVGRMIEGFQLFNKSNDPNEGKLYAEVKLDDPIEILTSTNIEVEWTLKISLIVN